MKLTVLVTCLGLLGIGSCSDEEPTLAPVAPVVVIGIDGLDPIVMDQLLADGRLPTFQRFADEGTLGRLGTLSPTWSPVIWTTIGTGQDAPAHGIENFLEPETSLPFTSNTRRVPAIWNLASDAGRTVDCAGWWITWPAEPVNGRMVASYAAQAQAKIIWKPTLWREMEHQTWPPKLATEIEPLLVMAEDAEQLRPAMRRAFPIPEQLDAFEGRLVNDMAWTHAADLSIAAVTGHLLDTGAADLTLSYLALPDVVGHRFWRYHSPNDVSYEVSSEDLAAFGDYLSLAYVEADRMLGELLAKAPKDALVIVLSDHGMHVDPETKYDADALTSGHHEDAAPGIIGVLGPPAARWGNLLGDKQRGEVGDVFGVAPMLMHLLDLPVPEHWRGAKGGSIPLERILDESWRLAHPITMGPSPDADFREATAPQLPGEGMSDAFFESFQGLGDLDSED